MRYSSLIFSACLLISIPSFAEVKNKDASIDLNEQGAQAMKAKDLATAEQLFKRSVSTNPNNLTAVFNLAGVYLSEKKAKVAIELLEPYVQQNVDDPGIYVRMGDAYFATKDVDKAKNYYEKGLSLAPRYLGLQAKLGTVYFLKKDLKNAEKSFRNAVEQNQKDGQSLGNLAAVLLGNDKPEEAVQTAKRALQVHSSPELYVTMGSGYERLKDNKNALISYERAKDLGDTRKEILDKIEELKAHQK